mgnify:CR=1 FL=1
MDLYSGKVPSDNCPLPNKNKKKQNNSKQNTKSQSNETFNELTKVTDEKNKAVEEVKEN